MSNAQKTVGAMKAAANLVNGAQERRRLQAIANAKLLVKAHWDFLGRDKRWANVLKFIGKPTKTELSSANIEHALGLNDILRHADWEVGSSSWPEYLQARAYQSATAQIRKARRLRPPNKEYKPLWDAIQTNMIMANSTASPVLGSSVKFHHGKDGDGPNSIRISPMWSRMVEKVGGAVLGARFITLAEKVDEVGGLDLYQVQYFVNPAANGPRWGYVAKMRGGKIRGYGDTPQVAIQWTERQVVIHSTRKLTQ